MIKKRIFIGSSKEELMIAQLVKEELEQDYEVVIWDEKLWDSAVFKLNQSFLDSLLKASLQFDYGILIGSQDDKVEVRGTEALQPRDNILFELGLFIGRLGISKCAFLIEEGIKILTDFSGIMLERFKDNDLDSIRTAARKIAEMFRDSQDDEVNFFPSATLATVYYENLVVPICKYLVENNGFDKDGVKYDNCRLKIVVPEKINDDVNLQFEKIKKLIEVENVEFNYAGRPRKITVDSQIKNDTLEFVDFPTVISGINHAISNLLPKEFSKQGNDYELILNRELRRFITTLKKLLIRGGFDEMVDVIRDNEINN